MRLTDSNSKGLLVFQTNRSTYFALKPEELEAAIEELKAAKDHIDQGKPRYTLDSRKY